MKNLDLTSSLRPYSDKWHYLIIGIVLLAISLYLYFVFILYIIYLAFIIKRKCLNKILLIILAIFSLILILLFFFYNYSPTTIKGTIYISEVKESYFTFYYKFHKYMSYTSLDIKPGDILYIEGSLDEHLTPSYDGDFNTLTFLRGKGLRNIYDISEYSITSYFISFNRLRYYILDYYKDKISEDYYELFSCLVLGNNILTDTTNYAKLNILHILALSGFHILLIYNIIFKLLFKVSKKYILSENISLVIVFFYVLLCGASISLVRAFIFLLLQKLNTKFNILYSKLDLYSITFLLCLINPLRIYNIGFIFSQISSFGILYKKDIIKTDNKYLKEVYTGLYFLIICFPFITNMSNSLSIFVLISFLFVNIITILFLPLCFIYLIIPKLSYYLEFLLVGFNKELDIVANLYNITFPYMNNIIKLIYYILLIFIFFYISQNRKVIKLKLSLAMVVFIYLFIPYLVDDYVIFLDVGQGDSALIKTDNKYYMIDCYNSYDYLVKKNIRKIEAIFITHGDSDHFGDVLEIVENIDVSYIYLSKHDKTSPDMLDISSNKIKYLAFGDNLSIGNGIITVLSGNKSYDDENDNSLVLNLYLDNYNVLFTGDISEEVELDILDYLFDIDILKVAHHGSNTSTSAEFIKKTNPEYSIISCGYNNRYNFPREEVLERLKYTNIYITYNTGNITFINNKLITYK